MKIWFDTEFIEDGKTIDLLSIGMVREDGVTLYFENADCDRSNACEWVQANVLPHLTGESVATRAEIADAVRGFAGGSPEFWAYYCSYDWVALCQLYGRMVELPSGWPMFCRDLKQLVGGQRIDVPNAQEHHALADAIWTREAYCAYKRYQVGNP